MDPVRTSCRLWRTNVCVVSLLLLAGCGGPPDAPPNLLVIIADDLGYPDLGFMGNELLRTPNIDRLAAESARFTRAYVPTSICRPSLATMLTGLYPHQHGIHFNLPPTNADEIPTQARFQQLPTLPRLLARGGYASLQTGKFWEGHYGNAGFTHGMTLGDPEALAGHPTLDGFQGWYGGRGLTIGREGLEPIAEFLDERAGAPFLIWFAPLLPHFPFDPPGAYRQLRRDPGPNPSVAQYFVMIQWLDGVVGEVLELLDARQLTNDTLVVFIADNGITGREFPLRFGPRPARYGPPRSKGTSLELGIRTPLLLRWPGHIPPATIESPVSSIDLVPTLLAAAGVADETTELPGVNLLPAATGSEPDSNRAVYGASFPYHATVLDDLAAEVTDRWVRKGPWKLIDPADPRQASRLHNLVYDRNEAVNLVDNERFADHRAELEALLDGWWQPGSP